MVQMPPQQSVLSSHASPFCVQYDEAAQRPAAPQCCEQQSVALAHGLPVVLHVVFSGVHVPPAQVPLQQPAPIVHAALSARQARISHTPPTHEVEQQSPPAPHALPFVRQPGARVSPSTAMSLDVELVSVFVSGSGAFTSKPLPSR